MADKKKKPTLALVISVGPKMKTKPTDAATPDMKKYGSMPMKKALKILKNSDLRQALANAPDNYALDDVMDATDDYRREEVEERYARMKAKKDRKIPQRPSPYFPASFPEDKPQELEQPNANGPYSQIFEDLPQRSVFGKAFEMLKQNYTRDSMPPPSRYDDEGFDEYDMEDMGPPYGKPEFGDEDARQAEMNEAERATIMAEGMSEMQKPRTAPRPGDPRFADPNKPRPRMPRDVFGKAWDMLKGERGGMPRNFKRTRIPPKPMRQVAPEPEAEPEIPTPQKVAAAKQQFDFINNIRRKRGEPPISIDEHLQQAGLTLEDYDREYHPEALE